MAVFQSLEALAAPDEAVRGVIRRVAGGSDAYLRLDSLPAEGACDVYEYEAAGGVLTVRGSSPVALCRGFNDYLRGQGLGTVSWADGQHIRRPARWPEAARTRQASPFRVRHAYNAVTFAYTMPFWTWERWERELDAQAMRGFNLLMAPVATEAIMERVWRKAGLTQREIDAFTCGPAHLPFLRMGCICGIGGPLPPSWHAGQVALQHKILGRMRELGIEPVVQGFNGFVPRSFGRVHPEAALHETLWNRSIPRENRPLLLGPDDPQFAVLTKSFMEEWAKEFGHATYFLVDSFNEMDLPKTDRPAAEVLAGYGAKTWQAIRAGNPNAIWTIQGWTFGYKKWPPANLAALLGGVPDDRMLVLDYANDYFPVWQKYGAFCGKPWAFGYVPNMGGKTAFTGKLDFYAKRSAEVLKAPDRGRLAGFTLSGEGLENNEMLYELLGDMAWRAEPVDLDPWLASYSRNRYGACPPEIAASWRLLREGCYRTFFDHPKFSWQGGGSLDRNTNFLTAATLFLSVADSFSNAPLYRADAIERGALALAYRADDWYAAARRAHAARDTNAFERAAGRTLDLLLQVDALMEEHPYHRLQRWIDFARAHATNPDEQRQYEANAKCIVTYWAAGVQNYSARVWGGLVRDYYRENIRQEFEALRRGGSFDANRFMIEYYTKSAGCSPAARCADPVGAARTWLQQALAEQAPGRGG